MDITFAYVHAYIHVHMHILEKPIFVWKHLNLLNNVITTNKIYYIVLKNIFSYIVTKQYLWYKHTYAINYIWSAVKPNIQYLSLKIIRFWVKNFQYLWNMGRIVCTYIVRNFSTGECIAFLSNQNSEDPIKCCVDETVLTIWFVRDINYKFILRRLHNLN